MRLCPWSLALASSIPVLGLERVCPRKGCPWPWPRIFFVSLALASSLVSSTPPRNSTELAVTSIYDELFQHLDDNKLTCSIFLDLRKAFDSVDHSVLLKKLNHYEFRGNTLNFFESYLKKRKICTKLQDTISRFYSISYGVPLRSVLGPTLF